MNAVQRLSMYSIAWRLRCRGRAWRVARASSTRSTISGALRSCRALWPLIEGSISNRTSCDGSPQAHGHQSAAALTANHIKPVRSMGIRRFEPQERRRLRRRA